MDRGTNETPDSESKGDQRRSGAQSSVTSGAQSSVTSGAQAEQREQLH
jgi:hypothetical protein